MAEVAPDEDFVLLFFRSLMLSIMNLVRTDGAVAVGEGAATVEWRVVTMSLSEEGSSVRSWCPEASYCVSGLRWEARYEGDNIQRMMRRSSSVCSSLREPRKVRR